MKLPPTSPWPALEDLRKERDDLQAKERDATARLDELKAERERVVEQDRAKLAAALRAGQKEPDDAAVRSIDDRVRGLERTLEALAVALADIDAQRASTIEENRAKWQDDIKTRTEKARVEVARRLDNYLEARRSYAEQRALGWFLADPAAKWRPPMEGVASGLLARNGEPYRWSKLEQALRDDAAGSPPALVTEVVAA